MIRRPPRSTRTDTLFPYTTLFRSCEIPSISLVAELTRDYDERTALMRFRFLFGWLGGLLAVALAYGYFLKSDDPATNGLLDPSGYAAFGLFGAALILVSTLDRKSTRLNSSH